MGARRTHPAVKAVSICCAARRRPQHGEVAQPLRCLQRHQAKVPRTEVVDALDLRGLDQPALRVILPAMVGACEAAGAVHGAGAAGH